MTSRKPSWLRVPIPQGSEWRFMGDLIKRRGLNTVCEEAVCPNKAECWGCGTATFMVLGDICTRNCRFCAVSTEKTGRKPNEAEPEQLAEAARELGLKYIVLTSVDRDDLPDRGASHFARCVVAIKTQNPGAKVEILVPDYFGDEMKAIAESKPDVIAHNVETVRRLQQIRDQRAGFDLSIRTLKEAADLGFLTKSSLMLGIGEKRDEILEAMAELRDAGCRILVMGQYLQPGPQQLKVERYLHPDEFAELAGEARRLGFSEVVSSPLARTSYHAMEAYKGQQAG